MVSRFRYQVLLLATLLAASAAGCKSFFGSPFAVAEGPKLSVTEPAALVGGQLSHWSFAWTKGGGGPYKLSVEFSQARIDGGLLIINGDVPPIEWVQEGLSGRSAEHDFTLPNPGSEAQVYSVYVSLEDQYGEGGFGNPFFPSYDGGDSYSSVIEVAPAP